MARNETYFQELIQKLSPYAEKRNLLDLKHAFLQDPQRFSRFSFAQDDLLIDFSKCSINETILNLLLSLAEAADISARRDAMFNGFSVNMTENRPALHTALRRPAKDHLVLEGKDLIVTIQTVLLAMEQFAEAVRSGALCGQTGEKITDIVHIGIGGSDLGPSMVTHALRPWHNGPKCHFVSNIDSTHITDILAELNPATSLIIIASKTLTTKETMVNAMTAKHWLSASLGEEAVKNHMIAVSAAPDKLSEFGIDPAHHFPFWDFIGGRYSVCSSVGLIIMLAIGAAQFRQFLAGSHLMDEHFRHRPTATNIPILSGLIDFWHRIVCNYPTRAIIPYSQRLCQLPAYLQQLIMESNGKNVTATGAALAIGGTVIWGATGTNAQHSFFQLLHQGTDIIPVEFIISVNGQESQLQTHHDILLANCLAQAEALMTGRSFKENYQKLIKTGMTETEAKKLARHQICPGNRPSITILQDQLTPFSLGRLIAFYEHRVFVEATLMNINCFDQWGVELGKEISSSLEYCLTSQTNSSKHITASLKGILTYIQSQQDRN